MLTACMAGRRFGLVTFARALGPWFEECVRSHGLWERCAGIRMLDGPFREIAEVLEIPEGTVKSRMVEALNRMALLLEGLDAGESVRHNEPENLVL